MDILLKAIFFATLGLIMGAVGWLWNINWVGNTGALFFVIGSLYGASKVIDRLDEPKSTWNAKLEVEKYLEKKDG